MNIPQPPENTNNMLNTTKYYLFDVLSISTVIGTLFDMLPHLAALASLVWSLLRIYETKTVQRFIHRHGNES